jgi:hypothetical protein
MDLETEDQVTYQIVGRRCEHQRQLRKKWSIRRLPVR